MDQGPDVYRTLQQRIDSLPVHFPATATGVELRLLRHLFTEEEAAVAGELSGVLEPIEEIHLRFEKHGSRYSHDDLRRIFDKLLEKGAITGGMVRSGEKMRRGYSLIPLVIGMFEMQVDRLTAGYAKDFEEYLGNEYGPAVINTGTGQLRTVPVGKAIESARVIGLYDDIKAYVASVKGPFAVMNCVCRQAKDLLGSPCDHGDIRETCLTIGAAAAGMSRRGNARRVGRQEFVELLDRAEERGFVIQPENSTEPSYICCCCGDCCEILKTAKKLPRPVEVFHTNFHVEVDPELCNRCTRCVSRCQMDAVRIEAMADVAVIDRERCIGCGLCISTCRVGSLSLVPNETQQEPPESKAEMLARISRERLDSRK